MRFLNGDGWRARLGIVIPSVNTVMEPWASRVVPDGVSVHFSRMYMPPETTPETLIQMDRTDGQSAVRQLTSVHPDVIAYGCTASSIVQGVNYDAHLRGEIEQSHATVATSAAHAIVTAVEVFQGKRISVVSPYPDELDAAEHQYFTQAGFDVVGGANLGIADGFELAEPEAGTLYELGIKGCHDDADVLVMSCLNTRSHTVISALEQTLDKPVVTSTQATLWHALRLAGVQDKIDGLGQLFVAH